MEASNEQQCDKTKKIKKYYYYVCMYYIGKQYCSASMAVPTIEDPEVRGLLYLSCLAALFNVNLIELEMKEGY